MKAPDWSSLFGCHVNSIRTAVGGTLAKTDSDVDMPSSFFESAYRRLRKNKRPKTENYLVSYVFFSDIVAIFGEAMSK